MILGSLTERIPCKEIKTRDTKNFHRGNHKGEKPTTFLEIESAPKVKPKKHKDDLLIVAVSLLSQQLLLSLIRPNE